MDRPNGLQRTVNATSPNVSTGDIAFSLVGYMGLYSFSVFCSFISSCDHCARPVPSATRDALHPSDLRVRTSMESIWFAILAANAHAYVVLDGFDFGAGILHLFVAKKDESAARSFRRSARCGTANEVWLIASGGTLLFAFPRVYAAACSGFYLRFCWCSGCFMLRVSPSSFGRTKSMRCGAHFGTGSLRRRRPPWLWCSASPRQPRARVSSRWQCGLFDTALHRLSRWTLPGALDWYTALVGAFALVALSAHGALYLAWKTEGPVHARSSKLAKKLCIAWAWPCCPVTVATAAVNATLYTNILGRPWRGRFGRPWRQCSHATDGMRRGANLRAFLSSCAVLASGARPDRRRALPLHAAIDHRSEGGARRRQRCVGTPEPGQRALLVDSGDRAGHAISSSFSGCSGARCRPEATATRGYGH